MSRYSSMALGALTIYGGCFILTPQNWQEALLTSAGALIFALVICIFFSKNIKLAEIPLALFLIPYAAYEIIRFSGLSNGFLADKKLTVLLACGTVCIVMLYAGIKSISYLSQLLFWCIPIIFILFIISPAPNKISLFPEKTIFTNSLQHLYLLIPAIFAFAVATKYTGGTRGGFFVGTVVGLSAFVAQGVISDAFGSSLITERHPILACALRSPYPIEVFLMGTATFAATVRFGLFLIASGMPLLKTKHKNIYITILFSVSTAFLYFTLTS
ncbi:MAG: hypothetical protein PHV95_11595 [Eubacteriales bacterium]|nr:hypothetical protein [Eubacteriales bacterium]